MCCKENEKEIENIKISLIIPVYNVEKYLGECLSSIIFSNYLNLEIICINDGSTDSSGHILTEYAKKDKRIKLVNKSNTGVSDTRNMGLDLSTGDYIGFVDSDDYISPNMYVELLNLLQRNDADVAICSFLNGDNRYVGDDLVFDPRAATIELHKGDLFKGYLHNKLYKKQLWDGVRFNSNITVCEDLLANHYVFLKAKKIVFQNLKLYYYRFNPQSALRRPMNNNYLSLIKACDLYTTFMKDNFMNMDDVICLAYFNSYSMLLRKIYDSSNRKEYKKYIHLSRVILKKNYKKIFVEKYSTIDKIYFFGLRSNFLIYKLLDFCIVFLRKIHRKNVIRKRHV